MQNNYPVDILLKKNPDIDFIGLYLGNYYEGMPKDPSLLSDMLHIWTEAVDAEAVEKYEDKTIMIDPRPISTIDFNLSALEKNFLLTAGKAAALRFLSHQDLQNKPSENEVKEVESELRNLKTQVEDKRSRRKKYWQTVAFLLLLVVIVSIYLLSKNTSSEKPALNNSNQDKAGNSNQGTPHPTLPPRTSGWYKAEPNATDTLIATDTYETDNGKIHDVTFKSGKIGQAFNFNGSNSYIQLSNRKNPFPSEGFTYYFWINPATIAVPQGIISNHQTNNWWNGILLNSEGRVQLLLQNEAGNYNQLMWTTKIPVKPNRWTHLAITYQNKGDSDTDVKIYIDGENQRLKFEKNPTSSSYGNEFKPGYNSEDSIGLSIGRMNDDKPKGYFRGMLDEIHFFPRVLSLIEIEMIYGTGDEPNRF